MRPIIGDQVSTVSSHASLALSNNFNHWICDFYNKELIQINFNRNIKFDKVSFRYKTGSENVLQHLTLSILKGERVGIVGATGSGKSTMIDILMGLLEPTSGSLKVDEKAIIIKNKARKIIIINLYFFIKFINLSCFKSSSISLKI